MKSQPCSIAKRELQQGAATLVFTVILLVVVTLITLYTSGPIRTEQQVTANDYRAQQALNAAEAGLHYFVATVRRQIETGTVQNLDLLGAVSQIPGNCAYRIELAGTQRFFSLGDIQLLDRQLNDVGDPLTCQTWAAETDPFPEQAVFALVNFIGRSDDLVAERPLRQFVRLRDGGFALDISDPPDMTWAGIISPQAPLIGRRNVYTRGNSEIHSSGPQLIYGDQHFHAGGGAAGNIDVGNPERVVGDAEMGAMSEDEFFESFFGASKGEIQATAESMGSRVDSVAGLLALAKAENGPSLIWFDGPLQLNNPNQSFNVENNKPKRDLVVVITGNMELQGNVQLGGVFYANNVSHIAGTSGVYGSVISENDVLGGADKGGPGMAGTPDIFFSEFDGGPDPGEFAELEDGTISARPVIGDGGLVPGTWRDF